MEGKEEARGERENHRNERDTCIGWPCRHPEQGWEQTCTEAGALAPPLPGIQTRVTLWSSAGTLTTRLPTELWLLAAVPVLFHAGQTVHPEKGEADREGLLVEMGSLFKGFFKEPGGQLYKGFRAAHTLRGSVHAHLLPALSR